jgi:hypothetical protein
MKIGQDISSCAAVPRKIEAAAGKIDNIQLWVTWPALLFLEFHIVELSLRAGIFLLMKAATGVGPPNNTASLSWRSYNIERK